MLLKQFMIILINYIHPQDTKDSSLFFIHLQINRVPYHQNTPTRHTFTQNGDITFYLS
uniref:Uncharacterized protein n=1 Tax=Anguilla anguilla TaxID=7936 RepID=A0A0E9W585_ANGAN